MSTLLNFYPQKSNTLRRQPITYKPSQKIKLADRIIEKALFDDETPDMVTVTIDHVSVSGLRK